MNGTMTTTRKLRVLRVDEMPLDRLRDRATSARRVLRSARRHLGVGGAQHAIDDALERAERLLPGLMDRTRSLPLLAMRRLSPETRAALRASLAAGVVAPRAACGLSAAEAKEALDRLDIQEEVTRDVIALLASMEPRAVAASVS
jgi:hypothetical protein